MFIAAVVNHQSRANGKLRLTSAYAGISEELMQMFQSGKVSVHQISGSHKRIYPAN
jgi:predicted regulator of Ras-like GTPase activity (Roadblock/LC7/MglB family)